MSNYYKKTQSSSQKKIESFFQIIKTIFRVLLLLIFFHRISITKFGGYEDAIKEAKTIREVKEVEQKLYDHEKLKIAQKVEEITPTPVDWADVDAMEAAKKIGESKEKESQNIRETFRKNEKGVTYSKLDLEYEEKEWKERSKGQSFWKDPQRFIFIQPLQWASEKLGIENKIVLDILLKVIVIRLILNLISYPQGMGMPGFGEENEKLQDPYLPLEEKEKINKQIWNQLKHFIFNMLMMVFFLWNFSSHPFAFNRSDSLYMKSTGEFMWVFVPYLIVSVLSSVSNSYLLQKAPWSEFRRKNLLSGVIFALIFSIILCLFLKELGPMLYFLFSEGINFLINLFKILLLKKRKK